MERIIPWRGLVEAIEPFYPRPRGAGRRPVGIERMLRIYFLQHWFNLSDPGAEEALYDSRAMRNFVGIDLGAEPAPDETTICKFRHLMEAHKLGDELFYRVNEYLQENGLKVARGTLVDASIINAPSSTRWCWKICCMAMRPVCGETRPTPVNRPSSPHMRPMPATSRSTKVTATGRSVIKNVLAIATKHVSVRRSNMYSVSSRGNFGSPKSATEGWPRMLITCSSPVGWRT